MAPQSLTTKRDTTSKLFKALDSSVLVTGFDLVFETVILSLSSIADTVNEIVRVVVLVIGAVFESAPPMLRSLVTISGCNERVYPFKLN